MSIEAFQIASAVFGATSVGLAHVAYGLHKHLKSSQAHVASLQVFLTDQSLSLDDLIVKNAELNGIVTKVHDQRQRALERAVAANKARRALREASVDAARAQTLAALKAAPLRPREEVVAGICKPE